MAESSKPKSGGGCLGKFITLILLAGATGLGTALFFACQPQDLSDIGGVGPAERNRPARDLKSVLRNSLDRGYAVTLTETEINRWLSGSLVAKQKGLLENQVSFEGVWVRLESGRAEIVMERKILGKPFTVSMFLRIAQTEGPKGMETQLLLDGGPFNENFPKPPVGGRIGKLKVPQGFLILVLPGYQKLAEVLRDELGLAFSKMARIKIEENRVILNPRDPSESVEGLMESF
jgi:hypothetical protein